MNNKPPFRTPLDRHYLHLQFWVKVYQKNWMEFQTFFENIMEKAITGFHKIRPYGKLGDKGNDGYRPAEGIYYQVYAPTDPGEKEFEAAKKFKDDFEKLKNGWDKISTIKELDFVYNDKGAGLTILLEEAKAELESANPGIEFRVFTPKDLEEIFFTLSEDQILSLGFDIDSRNAVQSTRDHLGMLDDELDKESGEFVLRALQKIKDIVDGQKDEGLSLDYGIVETRALQRTEEVERAREKFESIYKSYPQDPRAPLFLAEIYLNNDDFERNQDLLTKAEQIEPGFWLLRLERLVRELRLGNKIDPSTIDEKTFPDEPRTKSNFYRIYASLLQSAGDIPRAESFIERAIQLNPDRFSNYDVRIWILEDKAASEQQEAKRRGMADAVLKEVEKVEKKFNGYGGLNPRSQSLLNIRKFHMYFLLEDFPSLEKVAKETLGLILRCYVDQLTEKVIIELIHPVELPSADFLKLQNHLKRAQKPISDILAQVIALQFLRKNTLFTEGKVFFEEIKKQNILDLIAAVESKNYDHVVASLKNYPRFALDFILGIQEPTELRWKIADSLPDDGSIQKEKLSLVLHQDEGNLDKAFEILQKMDLSKLNYAECMTILKIAQEKKAWDSVIVLLEKLLSREKDKAPALQIRLKLFRANYNLDRYPEAIRIGKSILEDQDEIKLLDDHNTEMLVIQTIYAYLKRGEDAEAGKFLAKNSPFLKSFEAKMSGEAEVYIKNGDAKNAIRSIVEAVKLLKHPSPEQYGRLYLDFVKIGNLLPEFTLSSSEEANPGTFVKLSEQERWFYLGDEGELDATKAKKGDENYSVLIGKKPGDKISFAKGYRSINPEYTVEMILPVEKYILWQSRHNAEKLTAEHRWDAMEMIEVPMAEGSIDPKYLIARLEDESKKKGEFFDLYCKENVPLALLAINEGGFTNAIGRITSEQRGFIRASGGSSEELNQQKEVAKKLVSGQEFYLDGTSALMLSETGLLEKIYPSIPGLKVPQSVISLLFETRDRFAYVPGQTGHMGYANGKIFFSEIDRVKREAIQVNFGKCIDLLERKPQNICAISSASKSSAFSEQKIAPSLCDACILAQREGIPIVTEDFLYLKANECETKKPVPEYCSSFALMRVLYEQGKISFEEYLDYFAYLSSYRVRFLPLATEDLGKAVFGDRPITVVRPEQLRKFNFRLTLSEEYGVAQRNAQQLVGHFLVRILLDDSILQDMAVRIFAEIVSAFPTKDSRKSFGKLLLSFAVQVINKLRRELIIGTRIQEKVDAITTFLKFQGPDELVLL